MAKLDFDLLAELIKDIPSNKSINFYLGAWESNKSAYRALAAHFATRLMATNPKFDREKFLSACEPGSEAVKPKKKGKQRKPGGRTDQREAKKKREEFAAQQEVENAQI
jgi:hypothetical protein